MCGILGALRVGPAAQSAALDAELARASRSLVHRGPDGEGRWSSGSASNAGAASYAVALAHRRLAIFDLSEAGRQPMTGADGTVVVLNGEIYNFRELRQELESHGHAFHTATDTEVLLAAYQQWGESCVERFVGMWAFALWDGESLCLSRDRLGQKPLYFVHNPADGLFAFASEIEPLFDLDGVARRPDENTIYRYLAFAEMEHGGATFFDGVCELPPASWLRISPDQLGLGGTPPSPERFWSLPEEVREVGEAEAAERVEARLVESVRLRLRSDAPVGLSLSGGLDSTLLLALANEAGARELPVFSTGYAERGYNENRFLESAVDALGCRPQRAPSDATAFAEDIAGFIRHLGQPSRLPGPFSQWRVARQASGEVKVLLDGQGADELVGGYMYHLPPAWRGAGWGERLLGAPDLLWTVLANRHVLAQYPLKRILERLRGRPSGRLELPLQQSWRARHENERPAWAGSTDDLQKALRDALLSTSLPALLRYGDRTSMAWGIENRCPFLDHRVVEAVVALPARLKIRGGTTKRILRRIAADRVPKEIVGRRVKMGFPTPFGEWLRGPLADAARRWSTEHAESKLYRRWIDPAAVQTALAEHQSGVRDHQALLWRLLCVGVWIGTSKLD